MPAPIRQRESPRQQKDLLVSQLEVEQASFLSHWRDLSEHYAPRRSRFFVQDRNRGDKRNQKIIDPTGALAARTLRSGMVSGLTSPARPWYMLGHPDPEMNDRAAVKDWLFRLTERMRMIHSRSNLYNALPNFYGDLGVFGTAAMAVLEDPRDVIRCYSFPIGSYMIACSDRGVVDTFVRKFDLTVRQLVMRFADPGGRTDDERFRNISRSVRNAWDLGEYEKWVTVVHVIQPNVQWDDRRLDSKFKRFSSCYYELGQEDRSMFLMESGHDDFPVLVARWDVAGEDVYGTTCPGMEALGDVKALQALDKKSLKIVDKIADPPMTAPAALKNQRASLLPGDVTYVDATSGQGGFRPAHEINPQAVQVVEEKIAKHQYRISRAFYEDLFLMLAQTDRREITAREIEERHEEKLLMLGPVLERLNDELLDPLIDRTFNIMFRAGLVPPPPRELGGVDLRVEYISILAQAQRMVGIGSVERFVGFGGMVAGVYPDIVDKYNLDQVVDDYADMTGVNPKFVRSDEEVREIREQRAQQAAAAQRVAMAEQAANAAKTMSETDVGSDNALTRMARRGAA